MVYLFTQVPAVTTSSTKVTVTLPQVSLAVTLAMSGAGTALAHLTVTLAGQVMLGGVGSVTVIVWLQLAVLLELSLAVHVRVILLLHELPGLLSVWTKTTATAPSTLSLAVTIAAGGTSA
jgi:hypothetical protein